ncbi:SMP-30/gluconolactonase/LRE family protein [[Mycobacterium] nativiensis]|uniref:SMP-30/gluconolactonase/LRE family protein n=1 Tax=[Mycobacterium] nativiensis TaxID=2855503 RepID=A0ABU5XZ44_9MYCO|nr:SMP-30/gluconolactonase/LRE family protein [Mycolicibacter sp. MYC340]MEB3033249.1 SMP-30/gluconolactonase/LRE family protein [Mycolicibacter sp. MYC340]
MSRKPRIDPVRWQPPPSRPLPPPDPTPELTVVEIPGTAPEDVVVDADGTIWTGVEDGRIIAVGADEAPRVMTDTGGRPLGLAFTRDHRLLICDSHRGLLRFDPVTGQLETLVDEVAGRALTFCSNAVESSDGTIYFTESTDRFRYEHYKASVIEARGSGSLMRRDPDGTVSVLVTGLHFANGVTLTADESAVVFAESTGRRLSKYWLTGPRRGSITPLVTELPGHPDNISTGRDGRIWVAMVSDRNALSDWLSPRAPVLRTLLWRLLPYRWLPDVNSGAWVVAFDADDGRVLSQFRSHDPRFGLATGVVETGDRLWLGRIGGPGLAYFPL